MVNQSVDDSEVSSTEDSDAVADNATNDSTAITAINSERTAWSEMGPDINSHTVGPSEVRPDVVGSDSDVSCSTLALPPVSADTELKVLYDTPSEPTHLNTLPLGDRAIGSPVDAATKSIWEEGFVFSLMLSSEDEESSGEETVLTPCRYPRPDTQPANDDGDGKISHITEIYVSRRDVCGTTGDNKGCSVVCPVKDNGDSSDVNLVKDKDSSDVDIVQDKDSCDVDLVQDKDSSSVNLVQDKDSSDVNIIVQDKDSCDVNLVQDKDSSSVNIIVQDKDSSDVNIVQDKDSSDVNLVQEKYSSDVSLVQDKDSSDVNIVQDKDSSDVSLVQDKDSSDVNLVQDKDSSGDNFVQDKDSYGVNLVKDKDSSDVNLVQDKDSFGVNLVQDKDSSDDILVKDNDCSHVQDNNDGSDARMKKTEPNENRDDCNNTTRLLSVLVAAIVAVTGVVIFIKLQRVWVKCHLRKSSQRYLVIRWVTISGWKRIMWYEMAMIVLVILYARFATRVKNNLLWQERGQMLC